MNGTRHVDVFENFADSESLRLGECSGAFGLFRWRMELLILPVALARDTDISDQRLHAVILTPEQSG
jgi:hypothetical protein